MLLMLMVAKKFLVENKDFFEVLFAILGTVSSIMLGIMAWAVTRASHRNAEAQTQLLERQTIVAEQQLRPLLRLIPKTCGSSGDLYDCVEIWNDGAPITLYEIFQYSFLEITNIEHLGEAPRCIPFYYFFDRSFTGEQKGLLMVLSAYKRTPAFTRIPVNVTSALLELEEALRGRAGLCVRSYLDIAYIDQLGKVDEAYYEIYPSYWYWSGQRLAKRISKELGLQVNTAFMPPSQLNLATIMAEQVLKMWDEAKPLVLEYTGPGPGP
ncbi:MAG TPA: hypothetical protein VOA87_16385 [Thermoanaerobaculia bacterium]|nr:hypothetical protein [Thermoanaerobaculia bacterium]